MTTAQPAAPPPRGLLRPLSLAAGGVLAFLVLLLMLAPTVLSTDAGTRWLMGMIDRRAPGTVSVTDLELGWLSGFKARGLEVRDAEGKLLLAAPEIDTELTLVDALGEPPSLGKARIVVSVLDVRLLPDGGTNLQRALGMEPGGEGPLIPATGDVTLVLDRATITAPDAPVTTARDVTVHLVADAGGGPLKLEANGELRASGLASRVRADIEGELRDGGKFVVFTAPSLLEERAPDGSGNSLRIAKGSRLAFAGGNSDLTATADYDLARLQVLLAPMLPESLEMAGRHSMSLRVHGHVAPGTGVERLRKLTIEPTTLAYSRLAAYGLSSKGGRIPVALAGGVIPLGGEVPLNGGTLLLAGRIDLNEDVPRYLCDEECLAVRGLGLDEQVASGPLAFLPLVWGTAAGPASARVSGTVDLALDQAELPLSLAALAEATARGNLRLDGLAATSPLFDGLAAKLGPLAGARPQARLSRSAVELPFALDDGKFRYEGLPLSLGRVSAVFGGEVGIDGELDVEALVSTAGVDVEVPFRIGGTTASPQIDGSADALLEGLAPSLLDELRRRSPRDGPAKPGEAPEVPEQIPERLRDLFGG